MNRNEREFLKNYIMSEEEVYECKRIVNAVNKYQISKRKLYWGYPPITDDLTQGRAIGSIMCVKRDIGFDYYFLEVSERGCVTCEDFQEKLERFKKKNPEINTSRIILVDAFIYYLIQKADNFNPNSKVYMYNGIVTKAHLSRNGKYWLEMLKGYGSGMANDGILAEIGYNEPIFEKVKCFCGHEFFFSDQNIPDGEKYECQCPSCKAMLMRKKV